jgi:TetR/AcrR family transcriptional repressor of mexJK operon
VDRDGHDTRAEILVAAQRLFGRGGYNGVSMETIAARCDVNVRALYYHFASKRVLFDAAAADAFDRFGQAVLERVFSRTSARDRVDGYVDVYRHLHATDPYVLPFIGMVLVDGVSRSTRDGTLEPHAGALHEFFAVVVDEAMAAGEVHPDLDREGALLLLSTIGMGLALASLGAAGPYPAMLDALDLLNRGDLFTAPT